MLLPTPGAAEEPAGEDAGSDDEAQVVPAAVVVGFVDVDVVVEQRDNEGDGRDDAVPQPQPEPGDLASRAEGVQSGVRSGRAAGEEEGKEDKDQDDFHSYLKWNKPGLSQNDRI